MAAKPTRNGTRPTISDQELAESTTRTLRQKYKLTHDQVHQMRQRRGIVMTAEARAAAYADRDAVTKLNAIFDEEPPDRMSWSALQERIEALKVVKEVQDRYDPKRHTLACKLPGDKPVGIVFTGDWQLGSKGVNYAAWEEGMIGQLWKFHQKDPDGLLAIGMGDYQSALGNLNIRGSQHRDIDPAGSQYALLQTFFHLTAGMWLVLVQGCHDTFTTNKGDIDPVISYCELSGARHGWHGTALTASLGKQQYVIRLRHKYRYNSSLNPANSQRRQAEIEGPADIVAHAHLHTSFTYEGAAGGQDTLMLRSGSYQLDDDFARQQVGNVQADDRMPMAILWPNKKKIWSVRDFREGLDYLRHLRTVD